MGVQISFNWKDLLPHNEVILSAQQLGFTDEDEHIPYITYTIEVVPGVVARYEARKEEYRALHPGQSCPVTVREMHSVRRHKEWVANGLFFSLGTKVSDTASADCAHPQALYLLEFLIENRVPFQVS